MRKEDFNKIFDKIYNLTDGEPQVNSCPDVVIDFSTISWTLKVDIYLNGFTLGNKPDYCYYLDNESSDDEVHAVISVLEACELFKHTFLNNWRGDLQPTIEQNLEKYF